MTNEKAIQLLHRLSDEQFDGIHGDERREALSMAVRALEPNLGNNGSICTKTGVNDEDRTTDDTISRKMAIDVIDAIFPVDPMKTEYAQGIACGAALAKTYIKQLPSAQPEITEDDVKEFCRKRCLIVVTSDLYDEMTRRWASAQPETHDKRTETHACDLISRQQAIEAFEPEHHTDWYTPTIIKTLEELPQAQPQRKTGKWIQLYDNTWMCDNCEQTEQFGENIESTSNFCPNCGARMEGESDETG